MVTLVAYVITHKLTSLGHTHVVCWWGTGTVLTNPQHWSCSLYVSLTITWHLFTFTWYISKASGPSIQAHGNDSDSSGISV